MAKLGTDQDVTDAPGGGVGQILTMLGKAGPEIGASEKERRANIRQQDRDISKLEIQYKDAIAKGDLELANTYMAQLQALSAEYAKYMTAKAASLEGGLSEVPAIDIKDIITTVAGETSPQLKSLLETGSTLSGLNPSIKNVRTGKADGVWKQTDILRWATKLAFDQLQFKYYDQGKRPINKDQAFINQVTANVSLLFDGATPKVLDAAEGDPKIDDDSLDNDDDTSTISDAKKLIENF